ncbi:phage major capsid protein [Clostridium baratii]|uniref:phage major capsid protein n=1 Tax=Clostridium baratii TaxID=1561 RepID=UPI0030D5FC67
MLRKQIEKMLDKKIEARKALRERADKATTIEELRKIDSEAEALDNEIEEFRNMLKSEEDEPEEEENNTQEKRSTGSYGGEFNPLGSYGLRNKRSAENVNDIEYRKAFMKSVLTGAEIPDDVVPLEERGSATTVTTDIGVLIPNTVLNQIIEKLKFYGNIFSRVTITNIKGGVTIPTSNTKPTASWVSEGQVANTQKKEVKGKVIFAYHKLQCRVAISLEAATTSLAIFESNLIDNVSEAMIIAIEEAIIKGSGSGQPLGIINDTRIEEEQKIDVKAKEISSWKAWSKIFAKVPLRKRSGVVIILNNETYEGDIQGMTDTNGQPVARTTYGIDGTESYRFKGKEVIPVEDYLPSFDAAGAGDVFGIIINLKDYMFNSNLQTTIKRYFDEDTDQHILKATALADGKLADAQGVILLKKANEA